MSRIAPLLVAVAVAGCGAERVEPPDPFAVEPPAGVSAESVRAANATMAFERPANWDMTEDQPPREFTLRSGEAAVVAWAHPRSEPLPRRGPPLEQARRALVAETMKRDPRFRLSGSRVLDVAGAPAVEVTGTQTLSGRPLAVRSVHLYDRSIEFVIEALAPPQSIEAVDRGVLEPLLESLRVEPGG